MSTSEEQRRQVLRLRQEPNDNFHLHTMEVAMTSCGRGVSPRLWEGLQARISSFRLWKLEVPDPESSDSATSSDDDEALTHGPVGQATDVLLQVRISKSDEGNLYALDLQLSL